jgi:hypothetical protein
VRFAELICPAAPVLPSRSTQFPDVGATHTKPKRAPPTTSTEPPVTVKAPIFVAFSMVGKALKFSLILSALEMAGEMRRKDSAASLNILDIEVTLYTFLGGHKRGSGPSGRVQEEVASYLGEQRIECNPTSKDKKYLIF